MQGGAYTFSIPIKAKQSIFSCGWAFASEQEVISDFKMWPFMEIARAEKWNCQLFWSIFNSSPLLLTSIYSAEEVQSCAQHQVSTFYQTKFCSKPAKTHQSTFCCYFVCLCMLAVWSIRNTISLQKRLNLRKIAKNFHKQFCNPKYSLLKKFNWNH